MKPTIVISSPVDTYSGYGARSRDFVQAIIDLDKYDVKLLSQRWGNTRFGYLRDHGRDDILSLIIPKLDAKPDIWVQITVPNEFQPVGNYNIGVTAGIETTLCDQSWIQGLNRMDLILTSSVHSKKVLEDTKWELKDNRTGQVQKLETIKPVEVLFEGVDITKYFITKSKLDLSAINESFCFLSVGHWLQGTFGNDRKNIGYTVKLFLDTFKNKPNPPALILKTSHATTSLIDKTNLMNKLDFIRKTVKGKLPNVYILHGDLSDQEINELYNHPKVKAMVTHTRGEGFGRPLLEFSMTGKPIIASGWSGQVDFLNPSYTNLLPGTLTKLDPSSVVKGVLLPDSQWFKVDDAAASKAFKMVHKHYKKYITPAKKLKHENKEKFSYSAMVESLKTIVEKYVTDTKPQPKLTKLSLPKLKRV
jgi:glycosyltransferase involved in cell wall biosynthesis